MRRRRFLEIWGALPAIAAASGVWAMGQLNEDRTAFSWEFGDNRMSCRFRAPTRGWLAVGFNEETRLRGTRFVIAALENDRPKIEERIALVPNHAEVKSRGLPEVIGDASIQHLGSEAELRFSYPSLFSDRPKLRLQLGQRVYLMLAWSMEADFQHHSAWRRHFNLTL